MARLAGILIVGTKIAAYLRLADLSPHGVAVLSAPGVGTKRFQRTIRE